MNYDLPDELTVEADGPVRTVVINRPDELNAVNPGLHWALANVWRQLSADREARVVILTGAGRAFCAGGDLDWITSFLDDPAAPVREPSRRRPDHRGDAPFPVAGDRRRQRRRRRARVQHRRCCATSCSCPTTRTSPILTSRSVWWPATAAPPSGRC